MTTAALAMLTSPCPQKFELYWWKAAGNGEFWRQDTTCSDRVVHSVLHTKTYLPWPIWPWELFVPLKAKQTFFGTVWFRAAHHLRLLRAFIPLRN